MPGEAIYIYGLLTSSLSTQLFRDQRTKTKDDILISRCFKVVGYLYAILNDKQKWNARDNHSVMGESHYCHVRTVLRVAGLAQYFQSELIEIINLFVINIICVYRLSKILKMIGYGYCYWGHVEVNSGEGKVKWEISWIRGSIFVDLEAWMNIDFFPSQLTIQSA